MKTRVVCWNVAGRVEPLRQLADMDADVGLLQEVKGNPAEIDERIRVGDSRHWDSHYWNSNWHENRWGHLFDRWPMVVQLSDRVQVDWFKQVSAISVTERDEIAVSGIGTIAAARITPEGGKPFIAVSMYARWIKPHPSTNSSWMGFADGSAHRIISDLSAFIGSCDPSTHRILAAGDLNTICGAKDDNRLALPARDRTIWDRMGALGLEFLGPQTPNGRRADPTPSGLPPDTKNVPTYHTPRRTPRTAENQLDYGFASRGFHKQISVRAMNEVADWGASDHCRLLIEVCA